MRGNPMNVNPIALNVRKGLSKIHWRQTIGRYRLSSNGGGRCWIHRYPKKSPSVKGLKFTVVRVRFNDLKILVKRQFTLVLNIKWKENSKREG
jgi:hypothetical protein